MTTNYRDYPNRTPEDWDNPKVDEDMWCPNCGEPNGENLSWNAKGSPLAAHCHTCSTDYDLS